MEEIFSAEALTAIARIPILGDLRADEINATRIGGISNLNYRLSTPRGVFVLRLPRHDPGGFIDRSVEARALRAAEQIGVGAPVVFFDEASGVLLTRHIDNGSAMQAPRLRESGAKLEQAASLLARLHGGEPVFPRRFDPFETMTGYRAAIGQAGGAQPLWSTALHEALAAARFRLAGERQPVVPCHIDPSPENFIDDGSKLYLIDWEYAGMADPTWDLAYLSVEAGFSQENDAAMLGAYGERAMTVDRLRLHKILVTALTSLWGMLRQLRCLPEPAAEWGRNRAALAERLAEDLFRTPRG